MLKIIGGKYKSRKLISPKSPLVRPTLALTRSAVFNICQQKIQGARFLDLYAGSGAMGLEALSRGASHATFIEKAGPSLSVIRQNIALLKEEAHTTVIGSDVIKALPTLKGSFDLIYIDPPYGKGLGAEALDAIDRYPLLAEEGILFIEEATVEELPLKRLFLKTKRRFGRATLFEYVYKIHSEDP